MLRQVHVFSFLALFFFVGCQDTVNKVGTTDIPSISVDVRRANGESGPVNGAFDVEIEFGESVPGLDLSKVKVTGGWTVGNPTLVSKGPGQVPDQGPAQDPAQAPDQGPDQEPSQGPAEEPAQVPDQDPGQSLYRVTISPPAVDVESGEIAIILERGAAQNAEGTLSASGELRVTVDVTPPVARVIRANDESGPVSGAFDVEVAFSESVGDFELSDITVAGGSASALTELEGSYGATITPDSGQTSVTVSVAAGVATDTAGNGNTASTPLVVPVLSTDTTPPSVTNLSSPAPGRSVTWTWGCSESSCEYKFTIRTSPVADGTSPFLADDLFSTSTSVTQRSGDGTYWIYVQARDAAGNLSPLVSSSAIVDNTDPTVTVARANGETGTVSGPFNVDITFSESVSGFALSDISVARGIGQCAHGIRGQLRGHHHTRFGRDIGESECGRQCGRGRCW